MKMQLVLWIILAVSVTGLIAGCVEWFKGRGRHLAVAGVPIVALVTGVLVGDGHPVWRYTCLAIALAFAAYGFVAFRRTIRWRSPMMLSGAASIVLILVTELFTGFVPGFPEAIVIALLSALIVSTALFLASMFWEATDLLRNSRPTR